MPVSSPFYLFSRGGSHICSEEGHKASACPFKGKCLRYKGEGHVSRDCPLKYQSVEANDVPPAAAADGAGHPADDAEGSAGTLADGDAAAAADPSEGSAGTLADSGSGDVGVPASAMEASEGVASVAGVLLVPGSSEPASDVAGSVDSLADVAIDLRDNQLNELSQEVQEEVSSNPDSSSVEESTLQGGSFDSGDSPTCFKKGDRLERKNWRPITLLNVDYKLCSRTLAGRLLKVLHHVVERDQTYGVPGRYIGENVSLLRDLLDFTSESDTPAAILSLDQEKAFDRVDWAFMFLTLGRMGFGPSFIRWVRLLYTDVRSCVLINGYSSPVFFPSRGVRQGCPLSPLLYILTMEVLAANLRSHPDIVGLSLPGIQAPLPVISLYADDTSAIVTTDKGIKAVFSVYDHFEKASGSKLNLGKCKGLWLGRWRNRLDSPVAIDWNSGMIKVLGVFIGFGDFDAANWHPRLDSVSKGLLSWSSRSLSLSGKALVANALVLSCIWYVASLVYMPNWVVKELKVCQKTVVQPKDRSGLQLSPLSTRFIHC